ncbi:hypothetical protein [Shimia sp. R9_3]|uniref:hypothetical protein n=1 Tax=Shimia sp. R9_3 TaxID=2821113 RepID=UPI001ADAE949|nr:hypothetical protein [Shimia sp. R9_3]MBO9402748.1 hypothetical protein [Shimia sp. R9_3]
MPLKKRRSPQEKKSLSYERDRRDNYGENHKGSRKSVPKRKALANRSLRRAGATMWEQNPEQGEDVFLQKSLKRFKKAPHQPLGDFIRTKEQARKTRFGAKVRRQIEKAKFGDL